VDIYRCIIANRDVAEMREDLGNHGGIVDGGDDRQGAATLWIPFNIGPSSGGPGFSQLS